MDLQTFYANFHTIADAPGGVERLRELILDLAVRGKLVLQDPEDEPAEELITRIITDKMHLVTEKAIRKPDLLPPIPNKIVETPIPFGWKWVQVQDVILEDVGGGTPSKREPSYWGGDIPWASVKDVGKSKYIETTIDSITQKGLDESSSNLIPPRQLIVCTRMGLGKLSINSISLAINQDLRALNPHQDISIEFLYIFFRSNEIEGSGMTVKGIKRKDLLGMSIPLPPLEEQHRIVARVDELMALCDTLEAKQKARDSLREKLRASALDALMHAESDADLEQAWDRIRDNWNQLTDHPDSVDALRQAILQLAVRGKLVPQDPEDEPASVLLERIAEEKARLVKEKKIKKPKKLQPLDEDEIPFELPKGWEWALWQQATLDITSGWSPSCEKRRKREGEWGVLKVSAVSWGVFKPKEHKTLPAHLEPRPEHEVFPGNFLMSRANTASLVGRSVVVEETPSQLMMCDKILRVLIPEHIVNKYLNIANLCPYARLYYADNCTGTSDSMRNVSREVINAMPIPIPPLAEQQRIVAKVDEMMEMCERLEDHLRRTYRRAEAFAAAAVHHLEV